MCYPKVILVLKFLNHILNEILCKTLKLYVFMNQILKIKHTAASMIDLKTKIKNKNRCKEMKFHLKC